MLDEGARWLACAVPLSAIADRYPPLRERTVKARNRQLLRAAYAFWGRRFAPWSGRKRKSAPIRVHSYLGFS